MDRDEAVERLTKAFSAGTIDMDEFERRVDQAQTADEMELRRLLRDLDRDAGPSSSPAGRRPRTDPAPGATESFIVNEGRVPRKGEFAAIFSSAERRGSWTAPQKLDAAAIFGSGHLDLREARLPARGMRIAAAAIFGSLGVIVPEGVNVRIRGFSIFGSSSGSDEIFVRDGAPWIEIEAVAIFGSCGVQIRPRR